MTYLKNVMHSLVPISQRLSRMGGTGVRVRPLPPPEVALATVVRVLVEVKPALDASAIRPDSSLTADLGLDSLDLVELANRLGDGGRPVDLSPWLAVAMRPGGDTVGSLAELLSSAEA